jgi:chromosome segregation ATPase
MMETIQTMPTWAMILIQVLTLLMGGGASWAYMTRRKETDAERIARYEGRLDARLDASERDRDALRTQLSELDKKLAVALLELEDARKDLGNARVDLEEERAAREAETARAEELIELLRAHAILIPDRLLVSTRRRKTTQAGEVVT